MYLLDGPIVGQDFCGAGCHVRDGNNTRQFCGDSNPGCYGSVHEDGQVLMGALWKVRTRLKDAHGDVAGGAIADTLFNSWMNSYDDSQIRTIVETHDNLSCRICALVRLFLEALAANRSALLQASWRKWRSSNSDRKITFIQLSAMD